jgi:hypothetical protein
MTNSATLQFQRVNQSIMQSGQEANFVFIYRMEK